MPSAKTSIRAKAFAAALVMAAAAHACTLDKGGLASAPGGAAGAGATGAMGGSGGVGATGGAGGQGAAGAQGGTGGVSGDGGVGGVSGAGGAGAGGLSGGGGTGAATDASLDSTSDALADSALDAPADVSDGSSCLPLVGWWRGEDDTQNQVAGAPAGVWFANKPAYAAGQLGKGFNIASGDYVRVPRPTVGTYPYDIDGPITLVAWVAASGWGGRIIDKITAGKGDGYLLDTYASKLRMIIGNKVVSSVTSLPPANGAFHHMVGVYDGAAVRLYVDGALKHTEAISPSSAANSLELRLGAASDNGSKLSGVIDEAAVFASALSDQQVAAIYQLGNGYCQ